VRRLGHVFRRQGERAAQLPATIASGVSARLTALRAWEARHHSWSHFIRHWLLGMAIGVGIELLLISVEDPRPMVAARNWALDQAMHGGSLQAPDGPPPYSLSLIDVDEETWRAPAWGGGEPDRAPRDKLAFLIKDALDHQARIVLVDMIIEAPPALPEPAVPCQTALSAKPAKAATADPALEDRRFACTVEAWAESGALNGKHIIFVRTLRRRVKFDPADPSWRASALDEVIANHAAQLHTAAPYFLASNDGVLRAWRLWRAGCRLDGHGGGRWEVLPSAQLAIKFFLSHGGETPPWAVTASADGCRASASAQGPFVSEAQIDALVEAKVRAVPNLANLPEASASGKEADELSRRIYFRYPDPPPQGRPMLIKALRLVEGGRTAETTFGDGVVIIGQSFDFAGDQHPTPLGVMSGSMVIANSLDSLILTNVLRPPSGGWRLGVNFFLITLVAAVFALPPRSRRLHAVTVAGLIVLPLLVLADAVLLRRGLWLDYALPLIGIWGHRLIEPVLPRLFAFLKSMRHRYGRSHSR
jgi:CHASE2 domain-containing sensor protein